MGKIACFFFYTLDAKGVKASVLDRTDKFNLTPFTAMSDYNIRHSLQRLAVVSRVKMLKASSLHPAKL